MRQLRAVRTGQNAAVASKVDEMTQVSRIHRKQFALPLAQEKRVLSLKLLFSTGAGHVHQFERCSHAKAGKCSEKMKFEQNRGDGWAFEVEQCFHQSRSELFEFFSDAGNLEEITPPWLNFRILTPAPIEMCVGALIDYKLRLRFVPVRWRTEIRVWEPPYCFVDSQLRGPYKKWIHEHTFEEIDGGTLMRDRVVYDVPGGKLIHDLIVRKDLEEIFRYRQEKLAARFGEFEKITNASGALNE